MAVDISETAGQPSKPLIVDWRDGSPVYEGAAAAEDAVATPISPALAWILKPGDLVCDWLGVRQADSRGLLRLFVNLTIYGKIAALAAFLAS